MGKFAGFTSVELQKPQKSDFDMSHYKRSSTRMGRLTPVFAAECIPSDRWTISSEILLRLAPLLAPIFDQILLYVHFFFIPYRLLWADWEEFITGGREGFGINPEPIPPYINIEEFMEVNGALFQSSSILDYLGCPNFYNINSVPNAWEDATIDVMPVLAYNLVWYEYYRDRNFISDAVDGINTFPVPSGIINQSDNLAACFQLRTRAWEQDYFTSALPWTQRGAEVLMPLAGSGSVSYLTQSNVVGANPLTTSMTLGTQPGTGDIFPLGAGTAPTFTSADARIENIDEILIDSSDVSINDFRAAYALQVWLERNAVAGSRYTESIFAHFAVKPQDARLQRPEYIGGGRITVNIQEVLSTAWSSDPVDAKVPIGNMAGHGVTFGNTNRAKYYCSEHGLILGIASIMNPPSYFQGMPRMFRRRTFLDYVWPTFAKLGEQTIDKSELYASPANMTPNDDGVYPHFGYTSRYADWKFIHNSNHGQFRDTLLFWTLANKYDSSPTLGAAFTTYNTTLQDRIFAVPGDGTLDNFWMLIYNNAWVNRALPYFGRPNTLGFS